MRAIDRQILGDTAVRLMRNKRIRRETGLYPLEHLYLFITMRCNAKCDHCFCWQDLNVGIPEMSIDELGRIAETMPRIEHLVLTGGEPTLRRDIVEAMGEFARRDKASVIRINTNALVPDRLIDIAHRFKEQHPNVGLDFQISLDGLEKTHDKIRGVPGNFKKVIDSLRRLHELRKQYHAFAVNVLTVITSLNYRELMPLNEYLRENVAPDLPHGFEMMRDVNRTAWNVPEEVREHAVAPKNMDLPPVEAFDEIRRALVQINSRSPYRANAFHVHNLAQLEMIRTGKPQFPCVTAGQAVGVIYSNGDVAHCEFTKPFANLADFGHDFSALWQSDQANTRRQQISSCHCTHGCYHGKAVEYSWKGIGKMAKAAVG